MIRKKQGFTLIEMLVVIAIIAILVSIVIPVVASATKKAEAGADAANLRGVLGWANSEIIVAGKTIDEVAKTAMAPDSVMHPGAQLHILFTNPGFIEVYYVLDGEYYGLDYYSEMALNGSTTVSTDRSTTPGTWYIAGTGKAD